MTNFSHYCNICNEHISEFLPFGTPPRQNARCPRCDSLERHRFFKCWLDLNKNKFILNPRILHFSPEKSLTPIFVELGKENYISADIKEGDAMKTEDMRNLSFESDSFNLIFCSHVVQHIREDDTAIDELYRVLEKQGMVILMGAFNNRGTEEKNYINRSGESIFIRVYKKSDFQNKLIAHGFDVEVISASNMILDKLDAFRMGFSDSQFMYKCTKH